MTPLSNAPNVIFGFVKKMFSFENGAIAVVAVPTSRPIKIFFETLFYDIELKSIALPFVVAGVCLVLYFFIYLFDFITGVKASRYEARGEKGWFKSDKGWSSIWKISIIYLMVFSMAILSLLCVVLRLEWLSNIFIYGIIIISVMAMLLDIHSIGENHRRRFGKKAPIFEWLDGVYAAINETIIKKIKNI